VPESEVLIGEFVSIDGLSSCSIVVGEISSLAHEPGDDAVETASGVSKSLLSGAQSTEVLGGFRDDVGAQFHDDAAGGLSADGDVEVALGVGHFD